jgi:hypothetical protein
MDALQDVTLQNAACSSFKEATEASYNRTARSTTIRPCTNSNAAQRLMPGRCALSDSGGGCTIHTGRTLHYAGPIIPVALVGLTSWLRSSPSKTFGNARISVE